MRGAVAVYAWVLDEPANRAFAEKRGYTPSRSGALPPSRPGARHPAAPSGAPGRRGTAHGRRLRRRPAAAVRGGRGVHGGRTERRPDRVHGLRGLAAADLEPPRSRPGADLGRGGRRPARGVQRGPHRRRHPLLVGDDGHRARLPRPGPGQARQERLPAPRPRRRLHGGVHRQRRRTTARCWRSTNGSATRSAPRRYGMSASSVDAAVESSWSRRAGRRSVTRRTSSATTAPA